MTGRTLATQFQNIIDDEYDITHTYQLMTQAKNKIELMYKPLILQNVDTSQVANAGDTYLSLKTLPADYRSTVSMMVGFYMYLQLPFAQRIAFRLMPRRFYVDMRNKKFGLTGQLGASATISHCYVTTSPDFTEANEDTDGICLWPDELQPLLPYEMARIIRADIDPDDVARGAAQADEAEYQKFLDAFIHWDADLKLQAIGGQGGYAPEMARDLDGFDSGSIGMDLGLM